MNNKEASHVSSIPAQQASYMPPVQPFHHSAYYGTYTGYQSPTAADPGPWSPDSIHYQASYGLNPNYIAYQGYPYASGYNWYPNSSFTEFTNNNYDENCYVVGEDGYDYISNGRSDDTFDVNSVDQSFAHMSLNAEAPQFSSGDNAIVWQPPMMPKYYADHLIQRSGSFNYRKNAGRSLSASDAQKITNNAQQSTEISQSNNGLPCNINSYNPKEYDMVLKNARYFVIKSYSEDDIHRSIKYSIWCSTEYGNKRLDAAFHEQQNKGPLYLLFSVNGSGHFCGVAEMISAVDHEAATGIWAQSKWLGKFDVRWIYVKDVPNSQLRHIRLENNENKPVTNSRDTQEVPADKGQLVLKVIHLYRHTTSIFDDYHHYEQRQNEADTSSTNKL